jgi:hypothetical protein
MPRPHNIDDVLDINITRSPRCFAKSVQKIPGSTWDVLLSSFRAQMPQPAECDVHFGRAFDGLLYVLFLP